MADQPTQVSNKSLKDVISAPTEDKIDAKTQDVPKEQPVTQPVTEKKVAEEPVQSPPAKPTASEKPKSVKESTPSFKPDVDLERFLNELQANINRSKSVNPEDFGKRVYGLYKVLMRILDSVDQVTFNTKWSTLLNHIVKYYTDTYSENLIFRFPDQWPGSNTEHELFHRIMFFAISTAKPEERQTAIKSLRMPNVLKGLKDAQKARIIAFYNIT